MKLSFRWYGPTDSIPLSYIAQIPTMHGVVSAVYDVPPGNVWSRESIASLKEQAGAHDLAFECVESVPVHEDIKLGKPTREKYLEAYCENIRRLGEAGVKCVCYNFMPVFDWLRSDLKHPAPDGSNSLIYRDEQVLAMDPRSGNLSLPGWDESYTKEGLNRLLDEYAGMTEEDLFANLKVFLDTVIPVCEEADVRLAIHPDDPPWGIFGLPRIITCEENLDRLLKLNPSTYNGLTLCTGSLGASRRNDVVHLTEKYASMGRVHFVHARNVRLTGERDFGETAHPTCCGSLNLRGVLEALVKTDFDGYLRPDHGRMIWGETGKPGYGLYDRALGATYLSGLWEGISGTSPELFTHA